MELTTEQRDALRDLIYKDTYERFRLYFRDEPVYSPVLNRTFGAKSQYPHATEFFRKGKEYKQRAFIAGNGSGKTELASYELTLHLTGLYPDNWEGARFEKANHWWIGGNSNDSIHQVLETRLLGPLEDRGSGMIPRAHLVLDTMRQAKRKDTNIKSFQVKHVSGGLSTVEFKSYEERSSTWQGAERNIWLDEEPPYDIYCEALARTRMGDMLIMTFTPVGGITETVTSFTNGGDVSTGDKKHSRYVVNCSVYDVPHLDREAVKAMLLSYPTHERVARETGQPSVGMGAVYPVDPDDFVIKPFSIPNYFKFCMAIDFGWIHPTACLWVAYDPTNARYYVIDEYRQEKAPPDKHAEEINMRDAAYNHTIFKICDPSKGAIDPKSGQHVADMYKDYGITFEIANNDVDSGIFKTMRAFTNGQLFIFSNCVKLVNEIRTYQYDKRGKIRKINDDLVDCLRYIINEDPDNFSSALVSKSNAEMTARKILNDLNRKKMFIS
jgi:phage terminase large subunit-like protein